MGHQRTRTAEPSSLSARPNRAARRHPPDPARALRQLQSNPLGIAPVELLAAQRQVGSDAVAGILGTLFADRTDTSDTGGTVVQRQEAAVADAGVDGDGAAAPEMTEEEAERRVKDARDAAASQAGGGTGDGGGGAGGSSGGDAGPSDGEARQAAQERADGGAQGGAAGVGDRSGGGTGGGGEGGAGGGQTTAQEEAADGLAVTPPTDQSTIPNVAELSAPGGHLAQYAEEEAWHDAWAAGGSGVGMASGERAELVGEAMGAGATEGLTNGLAAAIVGQVVKQGTRNIPYASGFLAVGEMVLKGQSPVEWGAEQFAAGGQKVAGGWGKLWGGDSDWLDRIEGFVDILDGLNSFIGTISTICFIVAGVLALAGIVLAIFGVGAALLGFAAFCAKAGVFLGKIATIVGIIVTALRLIIMAARAAQIMLSDADPSTQAKRADSLRRSTSEFTREFTKSAANRRIDQAADEARARREAAARPPDQPDAAPAPAAAGQGPQAVADTQQRQSTISRGLDAISAGEWSRETGAAGQVWNTQRESYLPDTARESLAGLRAAEAEGGGPPAPLALPAPTEDEGGPPVPVPIATEAEGGPAVPVPVVAGETEGGLPVPVPVMSEDEGAPLVPQPIIPVGAEAEGAPPVPVPVTAEAEAAPLPARPGPGEPGEQLELDFGPGPQTQLKALTPPVEMAQQPDDYVEPTGLTPGAIHKYEDLPRGGKTADPPVIGEHVFPAMEQAEVDPTYEYASPTGTPRGGFGTQEQDVLVTGEHTATDKTRGDRTSLREVRDRIARGEEVTWEERHVAGLAREREALDRVVPQHPEEAIPDHRLTAIHEKEVDARLRDPRRGFQELRGEGPFAGQDIDADLDALFAPHVTGPPRSGPTSPPPTGGGPPPSPSVPPEQMAFDFTPRAPAAPAARPAVLPAGVPTPAPETPTGRPTPTPTAEGPAGGPAPTPSPTPAGPGTSSPTEIPGAAEAYGRRAPLSKPTGTQHPERDDIVSQWERLRKSGENAVAGGITEAAGFTGEDSAFTAAGTSEAEDKAHREQWVEDQRQKMREAHQSMTADLPPPPRDKKTELDESARTYAELDVEERQVRFQQREVTLLQRSASEEMTANQVLQQLMAANQQAITAEQQELNRRGQAQDQLRERTSQMGQQAGDAGNQQQSQSAGLQSFVGRFTELMGLVPSDMVSNPGQGSGAAGQLGQGFQQGGQGTQDAQARSAAAGQHVDELNSQTQECRSSFQETSSEIQSMQSLASSNLDDSRSGRELLQQAGDNAEQKLEEITAAKQRERERQQQALQVMADWATQHYELRTTGHARLEAQMAATEAAVAQ